MRFKLQERALALAFAAMLAFSFGIVATEAANSATYTRKFVVSKGSPEYADVSRWLGEHSTGREPASTDGNDNPFEVTLTTTVPLDAQTQSGPPVALPRRGTEGDVLTFRRNRTCVDGGGVETWTYQWVGDSTSGSWRLTNYSFSLSGGIYCDS